MTNDNSTPLALWRSPVARALHRNRSQPHHRYVQLATVRDDGSPANRTVVFRGFLEGSNQLMMITDWRSAKVGQLTAQPQAEICWYFSKTREQFRLHGLLELVDAHHGDAHLVDVRRQRWLQLTNDSRVQFYWPHPGKERVASDEAFQVETDSQSPPDTFCLLLLDPGWVDHLELREHPHQRTYYRRQDDGHWSSSRLNP